MNKKTIEELPEPSLIEIEKDEKHLKKINERWDDLREYAEKDLTDPPENDFHLPTINNKWLGFRSDFVKVLLELDLKREKIERQLLVEYRTQYNVKLNKEEEDLFIRTDARYTRLYEKCKRTEGVLHYIEGIHKAIENKYYLVKEYNIRQRYMKGSLD